MPPTLKENNNHIIPLFRYLLFRFLLNSLFQRPDDPIQFLSKYLSELPQENAGTSEHSTPSGPEKNETEKS